MGRRRCAIAVVAVAVVATACEFVPNPQWPSGSCQGEDATHGFMFFGHPDFDPPGGSYHRATDGDDVITIANGPVTVDAGDGDDLICVVDTRSTGPGETITIIGGDGDDTIVGSASTLEYCEAETTTDCDEVGDPTAPPNVIYIMADDLGWGDLSALNPASPIDTPNLDRLIDAGQSWSHFRSAGVVCTPTRAAYLSGQDPATVRMRTIVGSGSTMGLGAEIETLAELFNGAGYDTSHVGKWHLGGGDAFDPVTAGFQTSVSSAGFYTDFQLFTDTGLAVTHGEPNQRGETVLEDFSASGHTTEVFTDRAIGLVDQSVAAGNPFFLNLWFNAPHVETPIDEVPWSLPESSPLHGDPNATPAEVYIELVQVLDAQVGRLLDSLEPATAANTLVIFTSDNGAWQPLPNFLPWSTEPFRGQKNTHYEGGLRVPFIARWPGTIAPGSTSDAFGTTEDVFATFADIIAATPSNPGPGASLLTAFEGDSSQSVDDRIVVFEGSDLVKKADVDVANPYDWAVIEDNRWKLVSLNHGVLQYGFFDLVADPGEQVNLVNDPAHASKVAALEAYYVDWRKNASRADLVSGGQPIGTNWSETYTGTNSTAIDPHPTMDSGNADLTFSLDVTPTADSLGTPAGVVIADRPGSFTVKITPTDQVQVTFVNSLGQMPTLTSTSTLQAGVTTRVSVTAKGWQQGAVRDTFGRLYLDAVREDFQPIAPLFHFVGLAGTALFVGNSAAGDGFVGTIDDLELHNRTLDATELLAL